MKPVKLTASTAAATVALGLGVALASAPAAAAEPSSEDSSTSTSSGPARKADKRSEDSTAASDPQKTADADADTDDDARGEDVTEPDDAEKSGEDADIDEATGSEVTESDGDAEEPEDQTVTRTVIEPAAASASPQSDTSGPPANNNTIPSPVKWLQAAAARREVGDTDHSENTSLGSAPIVADTVVVQTTNANASVSTTSNGVKPLLNVVEWVLKPIVDRVVAVAKVLLAPVRTLLLELSGQVEESYPGSCVDSKCLPTTDIPLPEIKVQATFVNLTGRTLTLKNLDTYGNPLAYGPQNGAVLAHARQVEMGFYYNDNSPTYGLMEWTDGVDTYEVYVRFDGVREVSTTSGNIQSDFFNTPVPVTGPVVASAQTVVFLPKAGTEIILDPDDGEGQAIVAMRICGNRGTCTPDVIESTIEYSGARNVGNTVFNYGSVSSSNTYELSHEVVKSNGFEQNLKLAVGSSLKFTLGPLNFETEINAVLQEKYGRTWSDGILSKQGATVNVAPGMYGQIQLSYAQYHDLVDLTLVDKGVTVKIRGVEYISPVPADAVDEHGLPLAPPIWTTVDYDIGEGPNPYPDSTSNPSVPTNTKPPVADPAPSDIAAPTPLPEPTPKSFGAIIGDFLAAEFRAIVRLPEVLLTGNASQQLFTQGFEIVNLTPYPQKLISITGDYEEDQSPEVGFILQPFQMVRIEVDHSTFSNQEAFVKWQRADDNSAPVSEAELISQFDTNEFLDCDSSACMHGGYDDANQAEIMYIVLSSPSTFDLTYDPNLAAATLDAGCYYTDGGRTPGSCSANVTGQGYYTEPILGPSRLFYNQGSQVNSYTESLTTYKSQTESWSAGGGIKIKEKAGVFLGQQIELESTALYTGSSQQKESETTTVKQNVPPNSTGAMGYGDAFLRTYGDFVVHMPNSTSIIRNQWLENPAGLAAMGPVVTLDDYPGPPHV